MMEYPQLAVGANLEEGESKLITNSDVEARHGGLTFHLPTQAKKILHWILVFSG